MTGEEFTKKTESKLISAVGAALAKSILKNNLGNRDVGKLTEEDRRVLIENIIKAVALFETTDAVTRLKGELENLLKAGS